ncbi:MAG: RepB family plasmid replication initiator protein [Leptotrichiaceae bacterium]|nr:RepB family plasmid replication initiator protein [Leptotrichiaceae bacterium]MBP6281619.1 RepB family plasmid replication initiator protein [Leptotrichiaceae bacterium]MBP7100661.1 RepB family plasmid replication initiator protein [Leptotrichiaceae bacterium]MBP7739660.1 RepB family plasmid replication initiator protein [Leptotrichiaceae bacterium]MBP9630361.1 RepB family plasmid replication initiator protein [Leptotrichiaceae bacterium]
MNIFEPINKYFLENKKIDITFSKLINKKEKDFLKFIFKKYNLMTILEKSSIVDNLSLYDILKELKYKDVSQLQKFLNNLLSKKINFNIYSDKKLVVSGSFPIFSSYSIVYDKINFTFTREVYLGRKPNTLFYLLRIDFLIFIGDELSYKLYTYLISSKTIRNTTEICLSELKEILNAKNKYERFFDFETKILKKAIDDINLFSNIKFQYKKIKTGEFKNNKVENILFTFNDKEINSEIQENIDLNSTANEIINIVKEDIKDFHSTYLLIKSYIRKRGVDYVQKNINYVKKHFKTNVEQNLKKSLFLDLAKSTSIKKEKTLVSIKRQYSTPFLIHLEISTIFKKNNLNIEFQELLDSGFFNKLNILKNNEILEKKFDNFNLYVHYYTLQESTIIIKVREK